MKRLAVLIACALVSVSAVAVEVETFGNVENLHLNGEGLVLLKLSTPITGSPPCDNAGDIWQFKVEATNPYRKEFYSTLLAAMALGKKVHVGHSDDCGTGYPAVNVHYLYFTL
jgi:hypothetical protein